MSSLTASDPVVGASSLLRNEPVQARSTARLTTLLDAAASVVDEIGYERLTTAMVAERAKSSIGTVYRYFPDRITVLHALSARSLSRFTDEGVERISSPEHSNWLEAVGAAFDYWENAFKTEPGFKSLRFGDVLDLRPRVGARTNNGAIAASIVSILSSRHGLEANDDLQFHLEVAIDVCDALLARGFAFDAAGDERFITEAIATARNYLIGIYGDPGAGSAAA